MGTLLGKLNDYMKYLLNFRLHLHMHMYLQLAYLLKKQLNVYLKEERFTLSTLYLQFQNTLLKNQICIWQGWSSFSCFGYLEYKRVLPSNVHEENFRICRLRQWISTCIVTCQLLQILLILQYRVYCNLLLALFLILKIYLKNLLYGHISAYFIPRTSIQYQKLIWIFKKYKILIINPKNYELLFVFYLVEIINAKIRQLA